MTANERTWARQHARHGDDVALRAADVGDHRTRADMTPRFLQEQAVLTDWRGQDDQVGLPCFRQRGGGSIDGIAAERVRQHRRPIEAGDAASRPAVAQTERNRAADQTKARDGDVPKWR